jgi:hypothetical protein
VDIILEEDTKNRESKTIGDALELLIKGGIFEELCAYTQTVRNRPIYSFRTNLKACLPWE